MLTHPTLDLLHELGLHGMAKGYKALEQTAETESLAHAEWLGLLLEHEVTLRRQKRFEARARTARLRQNASIDGRRRRSGFQPLGRPWLSVWCWSRPRAKGSAQQ